MDYEELAKQYGGTVSSTTPSIDDLVKQYGGKIEPSQTDMAMSEQDKLRQKYAGFTTAPTRKETETTKVPFKDLYEKPDNFKTIYDYATSRFGKDVMEKGESKKDFVNRFATHMRMEGNNFISAYMEGQYMAGASLEDKAKAKAASDLWEKTASLGEKGAQEGIRPYADYGKAAISDPFTLITGGLGAVAGKAIGKTALKEGWKKGVTSNVGKIAAIPAVGATGSGLQNAIGQKIDIEGSKGELDQLQKTFAALPAEDQAKYKADFDKETAALQTRIKSGISGKEVAKAAAIGGAGELLLAGLPKGAKSALAVSAKSELGDVLATRSKGQIAELDKYFATLSDADKTKYQSLYDSIKADYTKRGAVPPATVKQTQAGRVEPELDAYLKNMIESKNQFDIFEGRTLLNQGGRADQLKEMQLREYLNVNIPKFAQNIWKLAPDLKPDDVTDQAMNRAVRETLDRLDTIDSTILENAARGSDFAIKDFLKAMEDTGLTSEQLSKMYGSTVSDMGRGLQALSVAKRLENSMRQIDPEAAKSIDRMYGRDNALTSGLGFLFSPFQRLDKELKGLMVTQLSTTVRNAFSTSATVTFGTAKEALESSLYRLGSTANEVLTGKPITGTFTGGLNGVWKDAVRSTFYLGQGELSSEMTDILLKDAPKLLAMVKRTMGEASEGELSKPVRLLNTLNVAQDSFFRQAIFVSSVEKQLERAGLGTNVYDVIAQGKQVPVDVLKNAVDESLRATFSKMPTKGPLNIFVKGAEQLAPLSSFIVPFPRFMANAMEWQYKYSPFNLLNGSAEIAKGTSLIAKGKEGGEAYLAQGLENVSKSTVGIAAIYAAYKYRKENQDTSWYDIKGPDGSLVDGRVLYPAGPFLAIGDYIVKWEQGKTEQFKAKEMFEALTGMKVPTGTYSLLTDKAAEYSSNAQTGEGSAGTKVGTLVGQLLGEYFGRAFVPLQQASDFIGAIDSNENLPRDAYQIKPGEEGFATSFKQQLQKRTPVLKQELPVFQSATREETPPNEAGILKAITGVAIKPFPNELEKEITRLKISSTKVFSTTGDKIVDAAAKKEMAPLIGKLFNAISNTSYYQESSDDMKKIMLQDTLSFASKTAKEIATDKDMALAQQEGRQSRIFENKYAALPAEVKRETAAMYKKYTGKNLEESKDYMSALAISNSIKKIPGFNKGGLASPRELPDEEMPKDEAEFQSWIRNTGWFDEFVKEHGEEPDLNTKDYDYRAAWKAGLEPERDPYDNNRFHWPSSLPSGEMLKSEDHPTAWKEYFMRDTGVNPDSLGLKTKEDANIYLKNKEQEVPKFAPGGLVRTVTDLLSPPSSSFIKKGAGAAAEEGGESLLSKMQKTLEESKSVEKPTIEKPAVETSAPFAFSSLKQKPSNGMWIGTVKDKNGKTIEQLAFPSEQAAKDYEQFTNSFNEAPDLPKKKGLMSPETEQQVQSFVDKAIAEGKKKQALAQRPDTSIMSDVSKKLKESPEVTPREPRNSANWWETTEPTNIAALEIAKKEANDAIKKDSYRTVDRKAGLSFIQEYRNGYFPSLREAFDQREKKTDTWKVDDVVLGVLQGEYRAKYKKELELTAENAVEVGKMADKLQNKLDGLREKYKDRPPMTLYHGSYSPRESRATRGFNDPNDIQVESSHSELGIGAPSFTKDLNLNMAQTRFGGQTPENYLNVQIPYADYEFLRVNMSARQYGNRDLNTAARTISGDPITVRPMSLPATTWKEHEDAIVQAQKLKGLGAPSGERAAGAAIDYNPTEMKDVVKKFQKRDEDLSNLQRRFGDYETVLLNPKSSKQVRITANRAYADLRKYLNTAMKYSDLVSPYGGMGQQYAYNVSVNLNRFYDMINKSTTMLDSIGSHERAENLRELGTILNMSTDDKRKTDALLSLTKKFNKGGLVSRP